jgi:hypothetical protein
MKKFKLALIASAILVSANADQTLNLKTGWNLVGTYISSVNVDKFNSANVVWKYKNGKWLAYSANSNIKNLINKKGYSTFDTLNSGEGFWVNTTTATTVTLVGDPTSDQLDIKKGWNLLTLTSDKTISADIIKDAVSIWKWDNKNQKWAVYSSNASLKSLIAAAEKKGLIETFNYINPGEGFWVYSGDVNTLNLQTPPSIGFAYEMLDKLNAVPLANADVYINGIKVGTTDNTGKFSIENVSDGSTVVIKKKGFAVAYGVVKNGNVVILTQKDNNQKVTFSATNGSQKVAKKGITSQDGTVSLIASSAKVNKDITVSVVPFKSAANAPALNSVDVDGKVVPVDQLAIIGGALINVEDSKGNLLTPDEVDGTLSYKLVQNTILGDLDTILNGDYASATTFAKQAFDKFNEMLNNGLIDILVLQFEDGKWVYKGKGKLASYSKTTKTSDGNTTTTTKYKLETSNELNKLEPTAFVLKMNYLTGKATICTKEAGYKMFDGSIVTTDDSNSEPFEWINEPIPNVTVIGDDSVTDPAEITDNSGCVTVSYKVPFVSPTFNLALKKDGYYDTEVTCTADADGAKCSDAHMFKIPDTASIEGYVKNKVTKEGIDNALVTLVNPEVLSADKIKSGDDNGTAFVKVGYMPNVTYTWEAVKYDDNNSSKVVVDKIIKQGKGDPKYAKLSEKEIYDVLVKPFDNSTNDFDAKYLTGNWELRVKAFHQFSNDANMTEEAIGNFDIDLLMTKLASFMSGQLSEKQVVVDENGNEVNTSIKNAAIYGGFSLGFLYEYGAQNDKFEWQTTLLGATDGYDGLICNDYNASDVFKCQEDPIASKINVNYVNIAKGDVLTYKKSLYPVGFNVKFMAKHFADLLNPDPACFNDDSCKDDPFLISGFTLRTLFKGEIDVPKTDENYNVTYEKYSQYIASYADVVGVKHVSDVLDTDKISLVGSSTTAYLRQVITKDNGYYRINMIPPKLSGDLEIFAKAEGYKFDSNSDIKLVNDLEAGKVSEYDLYLEPVDGNVTPVKPVTSFDDWNFTNECSVEDVKWQVVTNPTDIFVSNTDWANTVWGEDNVSLLPDLNTTTNGYVWFGDKDTGMFSDTGDNTSSGAVCGKAITPTIDLTNYSFPVLTFDSWFEVESVDVAKYQYDQLDIGFIIPSSENSGSKTVTIYNSNGDAVTVNTDTYYPLDKLNPDYEPDIQDPKVPYSSAGVGVLPVWKKYTVPVDGLAGYKVKFVFNFHSNDSLFNGFRGWGVDNVQITNSMDDVLSLPPMTPDIEGVNVSAKKVR